MIRDDESLNNIQKYINDNPKNWTIDELNPEYKQVIVLKRIEGLSHAEIAERLGKNTGAVRMLLARAIAALAIAYGEDE